jgi:hypothetical protein
MDTVTLTIDGQPVTVAGKTVLRGDRAASRPLLPPGHGIDSSCVCIVKIEKMPKLRTCARRLRRDGLAHAPTGGRRAAGVFEFLLINHRSTPGAKGGNARCRIFRTFGATEPDGSAASASTATASTDVVWPTLMLNPTGAFSALRALHARHRRRCEINIIDRG